MRSDRRSYSSQEIKNLNRREEIYRASRGMWREKDSDINEGKIILIKYLVS